MTKWVENTNVKFTCQQDIYRYLADDGGVMQSNGLTLFFEYGRIGGWSFDNWQDWTPMKRAEWYEDIPEQGVIGLAYDDNRSYSIITLCTGYDKKYKFPFKCSQANRCYKNFEPLTKEQLECYFLKP